MDSKDFRYGGKYTSFYERQPDSNNWGRKYAIELQKKDISSKMRKKLYDTCACCKSYQKKSDMITLLARSKRGEQPKQFAFMCKKCFQKFCAESGINLPKLENLEDTITF